MAKETVFSATNAHAESCGKPPHVQAGGKVYCGHFENQYGEQWVFVYDREAKRGTLRGGDAGWEESFDLTVSGDREVLGIPVLNKVADGWLRACLQAAMGT